VSVGVQVIAGSNHISQRSYVGTVESAKDATISANHSGTLSSLLVRQGQNVKAGQIVATINSPNVINSYKAALASLHQAQDGYDRAKQVYDSGSIPDVKMVEIETKLAQAKATAEVASNAMAECNITVPFDGIVSKILVNSGEHLIVGQLLLSIIDAGGLEVSFPVPENEISGLTIGEGAVVEFPSVGKESSKAVVKSKSLTSSPLSHTYSCTLQLKNKPDGLMVGMVCKVFMDSDDIKGIIIPADVVKVDNVGKYVWTVENDMACKKRITVGGYSGKGVLVDSGLSVGDILIVEGAGKVSGGMKVTIK